MEDLASQMIGLKNKIFKNGPTPTPQPEESGLHKVTYVPRENTDPRTSVLKAFHCAKDENLKSSVSKRGRVRPGLLPGFPGTERENRDPGLSTGNREARP